MKIASIRRTKSTPLESRHHVEFDVNDEELIQAASALMALDDLRQSAIDAIRDKEGKLPKGNISQIGHKIKKGKVTVTVRTGRIEQFPSPKTLVGSQYEILADCETMRQALDQQVAKQHGVANGGDTVTVDYFALRRLIEYIRKHQNALKHINDIVKTAQRISVTHA